MLQYFYFLLGHGKNEVYFCERSKPNCLPWVHIRMIKRPQTRKLFQGWMKNDCSSIVSCFGGICSKSTTNTFLSTFFCIFRKERKKRKQCNSDRKKTHLFYVVLVKFLFFFLSFCSVIKRVITVHLSKWR